MEKPRISAIAAVGKHGEIGENGDLIWRLEADFKRMKELIKGHVLIMGRSTYESIGGQLPKCVVITSQTDYDPTTIYPNANGENTVVVHSLAEALAKANEIELTSNNETKEVFIFGGAQVYTDALPYTERLYLTEIDAEDAEADTFFPEYTSFTNDIVEPINCAENGIRFQFRTIER